MAARPEKRTAPYGATLAAVGIASIVAILFLRFFLFLPDADEALQADSFSSAQAAPPAEGPRRRDERISNGPLNRRAAEAHRPTIAPIPERPTELLLSASAPDGGPLPAMRVHLRAPERRFADTAGGLPESLDEGPTDLPKEPPADFSVDGDERGHVVMSTDRLLRLRGIRAALPIEILWTDLSDRELARRTVVLSPAESRREAFTIDRPVLAVSGRCRTAQGEPIAEARVRLRTSFGDVVDSVRSAADGSFRFARVFQDIYDIEAVKDGFVRRMLPETDVLAVPDLDIAMTRARHARVAVTDPFGEPIPGADVSVVIDEMQMVSGARGDDGWFTLDGIPEGPVRFDATIESGAVAFSAVSADDETRIIAPVPGRLRIEWRLSGEPSRLIFASVEKPDGTVVIERPIAIGEDTAGGTCDFDAVLAGRYAVKLWALDGGAGRTIAHTDEVEITPGGTREIRLEAAAAGGLERSKDGR